MENNVITETKQTVDVPVEQQIKSVETKKFSLPESFEIGSGPYIRRSERTHTIMLDTVIALIPAFVWGCVAFGVRALLIALISVATAVLSEFVVCACMKKNATVSDLSAVITGLIIAMCLPVNVPLWLPAVGSVFAIVVVKQCFGGLGKNIFNPAIAALSLLSVGERTLSYFTEISLGAFSNADAVLPLEVLKSGKLPDESVLDLMIGNCAGAIGEVSSLLLLAGGIYLMFRRVISWHIPVSFIGTVAVVSLLTPRFDGVAAEIMVYEILSGALILAAFFMATDHTTSPITNSGKIIFGIGCGLITLLIRYYGTSAEGVIYAILIMNFASPLIEMLTLKRKTKK